jgi:hypothetical protein
MKHIIVSLVVLTTAVSAFAEDAAPALGLAERRAVKEYQEKVFPDLLKEIQKSAGFEVPVEVKWEVIAKPGESANYLTEDYWTNIFFKPLSTALADITKDDMGKEALKSKLKQIIVTFDEATAPASNYANGITFEAGVLTINFRPYSNAADVKQRVDALRAVIEPKL